jgi:5'-nucleotidase
MLPWLAGHVANLRRARARDGAVLLLDGGDMFQGTLESNLEEGASVVRAYNALGYTAATLGNHEFDYGPAGEGSFARTPDEDQHGALRARAREARFPLLAANIVDAASPNPVAGENVRPTHMVTAAGVRVGLLGVSTESTPRTTLSVNFRGLAMRPLADTIRALAREHQIPIVKDIPLARLLHKKCEIGHEVPLETFKAVAAVLAFVAKITGRPPGTGP